MKNATKSFNYEIGIFMFRASFCYHENTITGFRCYDVHNNFKNIMDTLNKNFSFDKKELFNGFSSEYVNTYEEKSEPEMSNMFEAALKEYQLNLNKPEIENIYTVFWGGKDECISIKCNIDDQEIFEKLMSEFKQKIFFEDKDIDDCYEEIPAYLIKKGYKAERYFFEEDTAINWNDIEK